MGAFWTSGLYLAAARSEWMKDAIMVVIMAVIFFSVQVFQFFDKVSTPECGGELLKRNIRISIHIAHRIEPLVDDGCV